MWLSGLGFWLPSSLPQNARTNLSWVLNQEYLVQVFGYGILVFELLFLFLIWIRPLRWVLITMGILLHLGIAIAYPIPHFALLMLALYIPLLPDEVWHKLRQVWGRPFRRNHSLTNSYAAAKTTGTDNRKSNRIALFILYGLAGQFMCMLAAPVVQEHTRYGRVNQILNFTQTLFKPFYFINQKFLGLVSHDIFLDKHFAGYEEIINISYIARDGKDIALPLFTPTGQPGTYSTGRIWTKWAYRVTGANPQKETLEAGIKEFIFFWAQQQDINLNKAVFIIRVKKIEGARTWEIDFLNRQMQQPWQTIGRVYWLNQQGRIEWVTTRDFI
jgi:hypothetical protein